jgi:hypothetical protein
MSMEKMDEADRVRAWTRPESLAAIDREIEHRIRLYANQPAEVISERIAQLDREWDIERYLQTNASALAFSGVALGIASSRKWLLLPLLVTGFLFQHATQGWCPPVPLFRKLGIRTQREIERERYALKLLRGDFEEASGAPEGAEKANRLISTMAA